MVQRESNYASVFDAKGLNLKNLRAIKPKTISKRIREVQQTYRGLLPSDIARIKESKGKKVKRENYTLPTFGQLKKCRREKVRNVRVMQIVE